MNELQRKEDLAPVRRDCFPPSQSFGAASVAIAPRNDGLAEGSAGAKQSRGVQLLTLAALLLVLASPCVFADTAAPSSSPDSKAPATRVVYRKEETHSFAGLRLKGELKKPELSYIYKRKGLRAEQIVNIPENFNDEIIEGAGEF